MGSARRGLLVLSGAALLFSLMALFAKAAAARIPAAEIGCMRFVVGLLLSLLPMVTGRRLRPVHYRPLILRGLFGSAAVLMYVQAIVHLPVGIATLLNSSWPIFAGLFAFLVLREPMSQQAVFALLLTMVGVVLVVVGSHPSGGAVELDRSGIFWAAIGLGSAVMSGAAVTTVRSMRQSEGSLEIFVFFCLVGALATAIPTALDWVTPTGSELGWLLLMGACAAGAQLGMTYALRDVTAVTTGLILQLTPLSTLLFGVVLFAERPTPLGWVGALLTLLGVTWGSIAR